MRVDPAQTSRAEEARNLSAREREKVWNVQGKACGEALDL